MLGKQAQKSAAKREAATRAKILRQVEIIEKLLTMLPADEPTYRLTREAMQMIRASQETGSAP